MGHMAWPTLRDSTHDMNATSENKCARGPTLLRQHPQESTKVQSRTPKQHQKFKRIKVSDSRLACSLRACFVLRRMIRSHAQESGIRSIAERQERRKQQRQHQKETQVAKTAAAMRVARERIAGGRGVDPTSAVNLR